MAYGNIYADTLTNSNNQVAVSTPPGFRNRIINGAMMIDQRNAGAAVTQTTSAVYGVDRWRAVGSVTSKFTFQQSSTAPTGFINSTVITSSAATTVSSSDYYLFQQFIEGLNVADLAWGTANAKTVTLSFWVQSSLTGTFGGVITNNGNDRAYPFTYTINSANTWEQKIVTIAGDTTGTWLTTNGAGIKIIFSMGTGSTLSGTAGAWAGANYFSATGATSVVGTNGATFYITGVQLEVGSSASSFDYRPYGTELALCQRYYYKTSSTGTPLGTGFNNSTTAAQIITHFPVQMRTAPTALEQDGTAADYRVWYTNTAATCSSVPTFSYGSVLSATTTFTVAAVLTAGQGSAGGIAGGAVTSYLAWSAEL